EPNRMRAPTDLPKSLAAVQVLVGPPPLALSSPLVIGRNQNNVRPTHPRRRLPDGRGTAGGATRGTARASVRRLARAFRLRLRSVARELAAVRPEDRRAGAAKGPR